jgi:hypothetical protein
LLKTAHLGNQFGPCHASLDFVFAPENQRFTIVTALQNIFGVVQPGLGKPLGAGHFVAMAQHRPPLVAHHAAEIPEFRPESLWLIDRPLPQRRIIYLALRSDQLRHAGLPHGRGVGCPQRLGANCIVHLVSLITFIRHGRFSLAKIAGI